MPKCRACNHAHRRARCLLLAISLSKAKADAQLVLRRVMRTVRKSLRAAHIAHAAFQLQLNTGALQSPLALPSG